MTERTRRPGATPGIDTGRDTGRRPVALTAAQREARTAAIELYSIPDHEVEDADEVIDPDDGPSDERLPDGWDVSDDSIDPYIGMEPTRLRTRPQSHLELYVQTGGRIAYEVRPPSTWLSDPLDQKAALARTQQLGELAEALMSAQRDALLAPDLRTAYRRLRPLTNVELSAITGLEPHKGSGVSRQRGITIQAPFGEVPLAFFTTWSPKPPQRIDEYEALIESITAMGGASAKATAEAAAGRAGRPSRAEALRKVVGIARGILEHPLAVRRYRRVFPHTDWTALRDRLEPTGGDRGKVLYCMALVGLTPPEELQ